MLTIRLPDLIQDTGLDRGLALAAVSALCDQGQLQAKIQIRCPECDAHEETYSRKSAVPDETITCFVCSYSYSSGDRRSWEVVYDIQGGLDEDFFRDLRARLTSFADAARDLPPSYFQQEFKRLDQMEGIADEAERGRLFDYFIGLLFIQVGGVEAAVKEDIPRGEIDVFVDCVDAPDWLNRMLGNVALVENKWESNPIGQSEIINFHDKAEDISLRTSSHLGYFISMSGFTEDARAEIEERRSPNIIAFDREDTEDMVKEGTVESKLRENVI